ncbi:protein of unknown function DUF502 [Emticicia oligotrophica DSM 17448]|uniref:DUF502 domain-containing protein n=1 Tax=Emticicia oligotrophica (strain DSM 17448 / CIP 109782 / MTCC 6937 / GPTSA100-15) TaxID=929562 RepID=A0ABN4ATA4_EMTOG|nr:DUF502 domain-containing protein [Emticicia oligotrophica]AFK04857.1 protein of unknown function DUF502 [Emticicia oligotrophica DSM 17448]
MTERTIPSRLLSYFIRGLLFVAPIGFTIYILLGAFDFVDNIIRIRIPTGDPNRDLIIPGLGSMIIVLGTMVIGFTFSVLLPQTIQNIIENAIGHLPLVRIFYFAFKDLISAFVGDKRKFTQAAIVQINKETSVHKIGFITQNDLSNLGVNNLIAVYFPHSYAFSGELVLVPKENVQMLDMPSAEVMKLIVSGGVSIKE